MSEKHTLVLKKSTYLIILSFIVICTSSCNRNEAIIMHWDLTGCSNPWDNHIELDSFSSEGYNNAILQYLLQEKIEIYSVTSEFDSTKAENCMACHCRTGTIVHITIPKKEKQKLKRLANPYHQFNLDFY